MGEYTPNSFLIPDVLVDEMMAKLGGTAFKCLLLIIRKTKGWNKEFDWIAISQFEEYTGTKKKAIYSALDELIALNLIVKNKQKGIQSEYGLGTVFNQKKDDKNSSTSTQNDQYPKEVVPKKGSTQKGVEPVPFLTPTSTQKGVKGSTQKGTTQESLLQKSLIQESLLQNTDTSKLNPDAWNEFCEHRGDIKKPISTELAAKKLVNKLSSYSSSIQQEMVDNSIMAGWSDVYPIKSYGSNSNKGQCTCNGKGYCDTCYEQAQTLNQNEPKVINP